MATKIITISLFFILTALSINFRGGSAGDETNGILPAVSTSGRNTFGCMVNDEPLVSTDLLHSTVYFQHGMLSISIWSGNNTEDHFAFIVKADALRPGTYELNNPSQRYAQYNSDEYDCLFTSDEFYSGVLMIHHVDTDNSVISGSFEFMAMAEDCEKIIKITDGRFDLKYKPAV